MNRKLLFTGSLAAFTAAVHLFMGTPEIKDPLLHSALPLELSLLLYACWHLVSMTLIFSAIAFFLSARLGGASTHFFVKLLSALWISFGIIFIAVALRYSGPSMLLKLPQWILLLPVGVFGLWGSCSSPPSSQSVKSIRL